MKPGIAPGQRVALDVVVTEAMCARFDGLPGAPDGPLHRLYGTASLVSALEWAARQLLLPVLEPHEEGVGHAVTVTHQRPTAIGETVTVWAEVTAVSPRRLTCQVGAHTPTGPIATGEITQAIVPRSFLAEAESRSVD
jgi:predicted thioesterase